MGDIPGGGAWWTWAQLMFSILQGEPGMPGQSGAPGKEGLIGPKVQGLPRGLTQDGECC